MPPYVRFRRTQVQDCVRDCRRIEAGTTILLDRNLERRLSAELYAAHVGLRRTQAYDSVRDCRRIEAGTTILLDRNRERRQSAELYAALRWAPPCWRLFPLPRRHSVQSVVPQTAVQCQGARED